MANAEVPESLEVFVGVLALELDSEPPAEPAPPESLDLLVDESVDESVDEFGDAPVDEPDVAVLLEVALSVL